MFDSGASRVSNMCSVGACGAGADNDRRFTVLTLVQLLLVAVVFYAALGAPLLEARRDVRARRAGRA